VTRACQGVVFKSVGLVKSLMEKTRTSKGLRVTVDIIVNDIIKVADYSEIETAEYRGQKSPLMALMDFHQ